MQGTPGIVGISKMPVGSRCARDIVCIRIENIISVGRQFLKRPYPIEIGITGMNDDVILNGIIDRQIGSAGWIRSSAAVINDVNSSPHCRSEGVKNVRGIDGNSVPGDDDTITIGDINS